MLLPYSLGHFFDWYVLRLRHQEKHKYGHDQNPAREEQEDPKLEVA